jgi:hypothetical protein
MARRAGIATHLAQSTRRPNVFSRSVERHDRVTGWLARETAGEDALAARLAWAAVL